MTKLSGNATFEEWWHKIRCLIWFVQVICEPETRLVK